jgi:hypothetical protein
MVEEMGNSMQISKTEMRTEKDGFDLQDGKEGVVKVDIPDVWYAVELRGHFPNGLDIRK